jgi:uncharacterized protein
MPIEPSTSPERVESIDVLRGMALFGVVVVNVHTLFRLPILERIRGAAVSSCPLDRVTDLVIDGLLEFKAVTIFSFLFGAGMAVQSARISARGGRAGFFLFRRMAWLLVFGLVHLFLIWNGDILALYAVCGWLLAPFAGRSPATLAMCGAALLAAQEILPSPLPFPSDAVQSELIAQARRVYSSGGFGEVLRFRAREAVVLMIPLVASILPRTAGLMLLGMASWRAGVLQDPRRHARLLRTVCAAGALLGGALTVNRLSRHFGVAPPWPALPGAASAAPLLLAAAYGSGLLLWLSGRHAVALPGFAAAGRMALTNYLAQSIVLGVLFYGYGLGWFGRLGAAAAACVAAAVYSAGLWASRSWLSRYRFGPFEWLWRSLTYRRRQPMRIEARLAP